MGLPDITFFAQLIIFIIAVFFLGSLIFKPFLHLMQIRHERIHGFMKASEEKLQLAKQKEKEYIEAIEKSYRSFESLTSQKLAQVESELKEKRIQFEKENQKKLLEFREQLHSIKNSVQKDLEQESQSLGNLIAQKFLHP
jgi:F0F1-type ATP synthase membrane subunit b/b'